MLPQDVQGQDKDIKASAVPVKVPQYFLINFTFDL